MGSSEREIRSDGSQWTKSNLGDWGGWDVVDLFGGEWLDDRSLVLNVSYELRRVREGPIEVELGKDLIVL